MAAALLEIAAEVIHIGIVPSMLNKSSLPRPKRRNAPLAEREVSIRDEYITLGQLLKRADIISTGGEAKWYLAETVVMVNGEPEQRRGRKLRPGDLIAAPDVPPVRIVAAPAPAPEETPLSPPTAPNTRQKYKAGFAGDVAAPANAQTAANKGK